MPEISDSIDDCWRDLIKQCWSIEPSKRPTFAQIATAVESFPLTMLEDCENLNVPPPFKMCNYESGDYE